MVERDVDKEIGTKLACALLEATERFLLASHFTGYIDVRDDVVAPSADQIAAPNRHSGEVGRLAAAPMLEVDANNSLGAQLRCAELQFGERLLDAANALVDVDDAEGFDAAPEIVARQHPYAARRIDERRIVRARSVRAMAVSRFGYVLLAGVMSR